MVSLKCKARVRGFLAFRPAFHLPPFFLERIITSFPLFPPLSVGLNQVGVRLSLFPSICPFPWALATILPPAAPLYLDMLSSGFALCPPVNAARSVFFLAPRTNVSLLLALLLSRLVQVPFFSLLVFFSFPFSQPDSSCQPFPNCCLSLLPSFLLFPLGPSPSLKIALFKPSVQNRLCFRFSMKVCCSHPEALFESKTCLVWSPPL